MKKEHLLSPRQFAQLQRAIHSATPCGTKAKAEALIAAARDDETRALWTAVLLMAQHARGARPCGGCGKKR